MVVEVVGFWVAVVVGAAVEVVAEEAAVPRVVVVAEEVAAAEDDVAVEVGVEVVVGSVWESEADDGVVTDADTVADKVVRVG